jgi:hypothetical protein
MRFNSFAAYHMMLGRSASLSGYLDDRRGGRSLPKESLRPAREKGEFGTVFIWNSTDEGV